ncbi:MAG: hotdog fold thioesterase [Flavobacteriaceae bacterium]|nr:hotdog fold thioesterase [Flavobacteriaceae bacterium]
MDAQKTLIFLNEHIVKGTLMETLDIKYVEVGVDYVVAEMPVNSRVHQPAGLLHGGATAALAESTGSAASHLFVDIEKYEVRGLEITANHVRSVKSGVVRATARPIHRGKTTHLWEIKVTDEEGQLISICKLTAILIPKKK